LSGADKIAWAPWHFQTQKRTSTCSILFSCRRLGKSHSSNTSPKILGLPDSLSTQTCIRTGIDTSTPAHMKAACLSMHTRTHS